MLKISLFFISFLSFSCIGWAVGDEEDETPAKGDAVHFMADCVEKSLKRAIKKFHKNSHCSTSEAQAQEFYLKAIFSLRRAYQEGVRPCHDRALQVESDPALVASAEAFCLRQLQVKFLRYWAEICKWIDRYERYHSVHLIPKNDLMFFLSMNYGCMDLASVSVLEVFEGSKVVKVVPKGSFFRSYWDEDQRPFTMNDVTPKVWMDFGQSWYLEKELELKFNYWLAFPDATSWDPYDQPYSEFLSIFKYDIGGYEEGLWESFMRQAVKAGNVYAVKVLCLCHPLKLNEEFLWSNEALRKDFFRARPLEIALLLGHALLVEFFLSPSLGKPLYVSNKYLSLLKGESPWVWAMRASALVGKPKTEVFPFLVKYGPPFYLKDLITLCNEGSCGIFLAGDDKIEQWMGWVIEYHIPFEVFTGIQDQDYDGWYIELIKALLTYHSNHEAAA
jgi:hypothetical protein